MQKRVPRRRPDRDPKPNEVTPSAEHPRQPPLLHDVLATVLHELRAPLSSLTVTVELLASSLDQLDIVEARSHLLRVQRSTAWLQALVENLTVAAQLEVNPLPIRWGLVDLSGCLEQALQIVQPSLDRAHQQVIAAQLTGLKVLGDERWLSQVLVNLLINASKYGGAGTTIEVGAEPIDGRVRVWVKDQGPGIAPEDQVRIFGRYVRGQVAEQSGSGGLGLGLHIVKTLIELHRGEVGVDSAPGQGATFWFVLSRVADGAEDRSAAQLEAERD